MDLPSPNQNEPKPIIPEMNGPVPVQAHRAPGEQWLRLAALVVVGLLVLFLLFLGGRGLYRTIAHHGTKPTTATTQSKSSTPKKQSSGSQGTKTSPSQNTAGSASSGSSASGTSSAGNQTGNGIQTGSNGKLSNTGPGSTAAIFTIATATGVIAYQVVMRRRTE